MFIKYLVKYFILKWKFRCCVLHSLDISLKCEMDNNVQINRFAEIGEHVSIGRGTYVNRGAVIASGIIGKYCSIGYNVVIGGHEHPLHLKYTSPHYYLNKSNYQDIFSPPIINDDVWVGANAVIKQGVTIGKGAVVGAGAVVTKDVAPYQIVGGVPARVIGARQYEE